MADTKIVAGFHLPADDDHFAAHLEKGPLFKGRGTYQFSKISKALDVTRQFRVALDIGAHVGLWSWVLAHHFDSVIAFEPVPGHVDCFRKNIVLANVELMTVALADDEGVLRVDTTPGNSGNAHIGTPGSSGVAVAAKTLDSFAFPVVDFIKIDTEGFETQVIRGAEQTIRRNKPVIVVEQKAGNAERYGLKRRSAVELLESWGAGVVWEKSGDVALRWS